MKVADITRANLRKVPNGEVVGLHHRLHDLANAHPDDGDYTTEDLREAHALVAEEMDVRGQTHSEERSALHEEPLAEAATVKARCQALLRDIWQVLQDKTVPEALRKKLEDVRRTMKRTWADLEQEETDRAEGKAGWRGYIDWMKQLDGEGEKAKEAEQDMAKVKVVLFEQGDMANLTKHLQKAHPEMEGFFTACMEDEATQEYDEETRAAVCARAHNEAFGKWPSEKKAAEAEVVTKAEGDGRYPAFAYLVVEDEAMPTTWHLRVRDQDGSLDHRLFGAAWAALHGGYRGNKYEGPEKSKALDKLKKLYDDEKMPIPEEASEMAETETTASMTVEAEKKELQPELVAEVLAEADSGQIVEVLATPDQVGGMPNDGMGPATMRVRLIRPGYGNKNDGHYYPAKVLKRDAHRFANAPMFLTDHKADEKSVRTLAGFIKGEPVAEADGSLVGVASIYHPQFARTVRNIAAGGDLDKLPLSIYANGNVNKRGQVDGKQANVVEAITSVDSVDWVTKAGAGGQAIELVENDKGGAKLKGKELIEKFSKNASVIERLAEREFEDETAAKAAVDTELAYIKEASGSGKVEGMGPEVKVPVSPITVDPKVLADRLAEVDRKFGIGR